jgi:hypothetical protein
MDEESYSVQAAIDTVLCYKSDMSVLWRDFPKFCDAIDSSPARYDRILELHPYVHNRAKTDILSTGYILDYPSSLFRCEYIIHLLYYHIEICSFSQNALQSFVKLRCMASKLKVVYNVSKGPLHISTFNFYS